MGFCRPSEQKILKNKRKQKDRQMLGFYLRDGKAVEYEAEADANCSCCPGYQRGGFLSRGLQ